MLNEEPPVTKHQDRVGRILRGMVNQKILRFGKRLGLTEEEIENVFNTKLNKICGLCQEPVVPVEESTIIVPCCGNRLHKKCFVQWTEFAGTCMYCRKKCDPGLRGFETYASYFSWVEWCNEMNMMLVSDYPAHAIAPLINALNSKRADTVKDYAAMQLFDLVAREYGEVYANKMVREHAVTFSLLKILSGDCGAQVKEAVGLLCLALCERGKSYALLSISSVASAVSKIDNSRFDNLFSMTVSGREAERASHRDNERIKRNDLANGRLYSVHSNLLTALSHTHSDDVPDVVPVNARHAQNVFDMRTVNSELTMIVERRARRLFNAELMMAVERRRRELLEQSPRL